MALYAIGDVQGCYDSLRRLLDRLRFDPAADRLWFTGDLVNRGPRSADVLRLVAGLGDRAVVVLGNHDLHLLAVAAGVAPAASGDTLSDILESNDSEYLLTWIASRPLLYVDAAAGWTLVHAGLLPDWDLAQATACAREAEAVIARRDRDFFARMYGDEPARWDDRLTGCDRLRAIVNAMTRLRYCYPDGRADYACKGAPGSQGEGLIPWFQVPWRRTRDLRVVFGHWSTLGQWEGDNVVGIDTGCCWGGRLTAVRLDAARPEFVSVACEDAKAG